MTYDEAVAWAESAPIGAKLRLPAPPHKRRRLLHLRGVVDGHLVTREWWSRKQRWNYRVDDVTALMVGLLTPEEST